MFDLRSRLSDVEAIVAEASEVRAKVTASLAPGTCCADCTAVRRTKALFRIRIVPIVTARRSAGHTRATRRPALAGNADGSIPRRP